MIIRTTKYIASYPSIKLCPAPDRPEYAFIGRSNVGKSSLINTLANHSGLAHTSNQPGKTQYINYYDINGEWYLVDLPGYGYARTPKALRQQWQEMIDEYLACRENLLCAFLLIDSCVPPQEVDLAFADWMGENGVPFVLVFTKTDRKKSLVKDDFLTEFKAAFLQNWEEMPQYFFTSSVNKNGREEILDFIHQLNVGYKQ